MIADKPTFDDLLQYLIENGIESDKLKSSVVFYVLLQMLKNHNNDSKLRDACKNYLALVEFGKKTKKKQSDIDWCEIIIDGLKNALIGEYDVVFPPKKRWDLMWYYGPLRNYIFFII